MPGNVAFIPVRGGSKSIPLKNVKPLLGKPLVYWTAAAAAAAPSIDTVYVSTDSEEIMRAVEELVIPKVQVVERSPQTAIDTASSESALLEFAEQHEFSYVAFIQATSPLLEADDVERGLSIARSDGCDSVVSVVEDRHFYWGKGASGAVHPLNYDVFDRPRRQEFDGCYQENGALYITSRSALLSSHNRVSGTIKPLVMSEETLFEIDEPADWPIVETLLRVKLDSQRATRRPQHDIRLFLTDCDGCLTDAGMYYDEDGRELKKFNTRDGMGIALLRRAGIKCGIITGESSPAVSHRAKKLQVDYLELGCSDKLAAARKLCAQEGIGLAQAAYMGDDINDLELLTAVGTSFAPADAHQQVKEVAQYVTCALGGQGAVREAAEAILHG